MKNLTESLWCQSRLLLYLDHWRLGFVRFRAVSTYLHKVTGSCVKQSTQLLKQNKWVYDVSLSFSKTPAGNSKVHIGSLTLSKIWISLFRRPFGIKVWSHDLRDIKVTCFWVSKDTPFFTWIKAHLDYLMPCLSFYYIWIIGVGKF